jgi:Ribbon-helix-helix domain
MKQSARWTLTVTGDLDRRVRRYLDGAGRKGDLSGFVEEAVRARLLQLSMKTVPTYSKPSANDVQSAASSSASASSATSPTPVAKLGDGSYGG